VKTDDRIEGQDPHIEQYATTDRLAARVDVHRRFSTNAYGWHRWVFDRIAVAPGAAVLELGCGRGDLWRRNADRLPEDARVTLSDRSAGMVREAGRSLSGVRLPFEFVLCDAQAIPFPTGCFDIVVANHMLYHVPDLHRALSEIARVLKGAGRVYAATNGAKHMGELYDMVARVAPGFTRPKLTFSLENGEEWLRQHFSDVTLRWHDDSLAVTEARPLWDYVRSLASLTGIPDAGLDRLREFLEYEIRARGQVAIRKETGLYSAAPGQ